MAATVVRNSSELGAEMTFQFQSFSFSRVSKRISSSTKPFTFQFRNKQKLRQFLAKIVEFQWKFFRDIN